LRLYSEDVHWRGRKNRPEVDEVYEETGRGGCAGSVQCRVRLRRVVLAHPLSPRTTNVEVKE